MTPIEIKQLRARLGLTQQALADRLHVTRNCVNQWEMGIRKPGGPAIAMMQVLARRCRRS